YCAVPAGFVVDEGECRGGSGGGEEEEEEKGEEEEKEEKEKREGNFFHDTRHSSMADTGGED
ncbi:hypothetical protein L0Y46_01400, partial [bacterium]|nr:hypothetical protein [bacterium]